MKYFEIENSAEGDGFMCLTYTEEQKLAQWVMGLLAKGHWFDGTQGTKHMKRLVDHIWYLKAQEGRDLLGSLYLELADAVDKWNSNCDDPDWQKIFRITSPRTLMQDDDKHIHAPLQNDNGDKYTPEERIRLRREEIRRVWRDEWRGHPIRTAAEGYEVFPGDDPDQTYTDLQVEHEVSFWGEVGRRQKEYGVSRDQAIRAVSDYMPRGQFPEGELEDPINDRSMLELMEVEYPDPPPLPDIDELPE